MNNKDLRKEKAINHIEEMNKEFPAMINASITNSIRYTDDNIYNNNVIVVVENISEVNNGIIRTGFFNFVIVD